MRLYSLLLSGLFREGVLAVAPLVHLDYTSYQGVAQDNAVTKWLGMRYAAPPVGDLRFSAPLDPKIENGTQMADEHGATCLQTGTAPPSNTTGEDCLFLEVYAPSNATRNSKLPVYFFLQGGGFNTLGNANQNGSGLVIAGEYDMVVVNFNYRVGLYGFLASEEILKGGSVNNGLKDQRKALEWVQKYISNFGGDPGHVTIGGDSAGAQSVTLHITAYGGRDDGLFHASAAESQSFSALRTVPESQYAYNNLAIRAGCAGANDTLACLRSVNATALQAININTPFPGAQQNPLFPYGPTLDYDFISDYTYRAYAEGKFVHVPAIHGDVTNEGTLFATTNISSYGETGSFIQAQFPDITLDQLGRINQYYPVEDTPCFEGKGRYWRQASDAYGEMRYNCPGIYISGVYANASVPNWNYRWNVIDPEDNAGGYGVTHVVEVNAIWGPENVASPPESYEEGGVNYPIVSVVQGYWTSFIRSKDPNKYRKPGTPTWEQWSGANLDKRMMFQTNGTHMERVPSKQRERCAYLTSIGVDLKQ